MSKHTPGPWETSVNGDLQWDVCAPGAGDMIADLEGCDNQEANANLIASAPELLQALKDVVNAHDVKMGISSVKLRIELANQAITKAEGRS